MSLSNGAENSIIDLYFNATTWADIAENDTTTPMTNTQLSLHTSDPGETGDQTTNETSYGSYARVAKARTSSGWTVSGSAATLTSQASFPQASSGTATITHMGIGTGSSGAGRRDWSGTVTPNISVATGVTPILTTATSVSLD